MFSDDDLKWLKTHPNIRCEFSKEKIPSLLGRLKAAEACMNIECSHEEWTCCDCGRKEAEAWRKAAGKS